MNDTHRTSKLLVECAEAFEESCAHEGRLSSFVDLARRCREAADEPSATLPPKLDTTMPSVWHFLLVAAHEVVEAVDFNHAHKDSPLKWTVPWAKVTALRAAVLRAKELNGAGLPEPPSAPHPDEERLNFIESECVELRCKESRNHDDADVYYEAVKFYMQKPHERPVGRGATPRAAIDEAMKNDDDQCCYCGGEACAACTPVTKSEGAS